LDEIEKVLAEALPLRSPMLNPNARPRERISVLEDYMLRTATISGGLYEAKHWLVALEAQLADEWKNLQGWETALRRTRARATKAEIDAAKVQVAPMLWEQGRRTRQLRTSVVDQITRLEKEGDRMSRAYSMESGS
jgi:hypothetical protein